MHVAHKRESLFLLLGDVLIFTAALWITLSVRYLEIPGSERFLLHLEPFSILFGAWILVFFIVGLYEKHTLFLKKRLPTLILNTQIANSVIAVLFFYLIPYFSIAPKTNLFIYLFISFGLILLWRNFGPRLLAASSREKALLIGSGEEMHELRKEINRNVRYSITFTSSIDVEQMEGVDFHKKILNRVYSEDISLIVIDMHSDDIAPTLPHLYNLIFSGIHFLDMHKVYEEVFDRVPISILQYSWFLDNLSHHPKTVYDSLKRLMDLAIAVIVSIPTLVITPFVILAIKLDDGGPIFYIHERLGKNNKVIQIWKFRSMTNTDTGEEALSSTKKVTTVGDFLRRTRVDELPQLWNVIKGDLSLIGPRPEIPELAQKYEEEVPYYNVRHLIKPGLSGWAQMYQEAGEVPKFKAETEATKRKLSYDLYYIKNRSLFLDLKIALQTAQVFFSRAGR